MKILLLSGGDGKRLWPLPNNSNAKQFIRLFPNRNGMKQSMLERVYSQLKIQDLDTTLSLSQMFSKRTVSFIKLVQILISFPNQLVVIHFPLSFSGQAM